MRSKTPATAKLPPRELNVPLSESAGGAQEQAIEFDDQAAAHVCTVVLSPVDGGLLGAIVASREPR